MNNAVLQLNNVSLTKDKNLILKDLNWEVKKGEHWVILGSNGSGKTMMLKMLSGYLWPSRGEIFVLGKKFGEIDLPTLRQTIGWVSFDLQQKMLDFKAVDVVISGYFASIGLYQKPTEDILKRADSFLKLMGLTKHKNRLFPTLSYGEQKKVLIARSLMSKPKLLLLDEPYSGLDLKVREDFLQFLEKIAKTKNGPTIILVTHHLEEVLPSISHVLALKKGEIIKMGEKKDILTGELVEDVLGVKMNVIRKGERYLTAHII